MEAIVSRKTRPPESVTLGKLVDWTKHPDPGVKHFSGGATYHNRFNENTPLLPSGLLGPVKLRFPAAASCEL